MQLLPEWYIFENMFFTLSVLRTRQFEQVYDLCLLQPTAC
jgi:hypothetical protein